MPKLKKIFITGGNGFIGTHLVKKLTHEGSKVHSLEGMLEDFVSLKKQLESDSWDTVIHLAGFSSPVQCENHPVTAYAANVLGTSLLLEALRQIHTGSQKPWPHFIFASTAQIYEIPENEKPMTEEHPIQIRNVYGETKMQGESLIKDFSLRNKMTSTILRLFNHTHISQSTDFFLPSIYQQIKNLPPNENKIFVGDLNVSRDFGTISDLINAFSEVALQIRQTQLVDVFNVCSGRAIHLQEMANSIAKYLNRSDIQFVVDSRRLRVNEKRVITGSCEKLMAATNWRPKPFDFNNFICSFDHIF